MIGKENFPDAFKEKGMHFCIPLFISKNESILVHERHKNASGTGKEKKVEQ